MVSHDAPGPMQNSLDRAWEDAEAGSDISRDEQVRASDHEVLPAGAARQSEWTSIVASQLRAHAKLTSQPETVITRPLAQMLRRAREV